MKKYFSYISSWYLPKNKLQGAIHEYLRTQERVVVPAEDLNSFKIKLLEKIGGLNKAYPRCTPVVGKWENKTKASHIKYHYDDIELRMSGGGNVCHFHLFTSSTDQEVSKP